VDPIHVWRTFDAVAFAAQEGEDPGRSDYPPC
jgi:hypothetical protein